MLIRKPFVLACYDTSLGAGRLSADWVPRLNAVIRDFPEAKGPVVIHNMGHGGWTSNDLLAGVGDVIALKPSHVLSEGGAVNDCPDFGAGPVISRATHNANNTAMFNAMTAGIPGVDITLMTMSSVSAIQTARSQLGTYYADEIATATGLGLRVLDNYAGWPKPLDATLTYGGILRKYPLPTGFSDWSVTAPTLDPAQKNANVTLSANNQVATGAGLNNPVRGPSAHAAGKAYFEMNPTVAASHSVTIGIQTAAASLADGASIGSDVFGYGFNQGGAVFNGSVIASYGGFAAGDVIGVAVDLTANVIWFSRNGTWLSGNPSTGSGGISLTPGTYFPACSLGAGDSVSLLPFMGDGLHPIWQGAVDTYLYPNVVTLVRSLMAAWWP